MLLSEPAAALNQLRSYLDEAAFTWASVRVVPGHESVIWPDFRLLQETLRGAGHPHRLLLSLLRQGQTADERVLRRGLPAEVVSAMKNLGLLVAAGPARWRTDSLALVPAEGLMLAVSLPPHYPTAVDCKQSIYLGMESLWLARALPSSLQGRRVLDICTGSGVQGLICAARGARRVTALELHPRAVAAARFNAALNGLQQRFQVRPSDLFSAVNDGELFDLIICNPPFMPVAADVAYPICGDGGPDGTTLLRRLFARMPGFLAAGGEALVFCNALGSRSAIFFNEEMLKPLARQHNLDILAVVDDKHPFDDYVQGTLAANLAATCPDMTLKQRQDAIARWRHQLQQSGVPHACIYGQLLRLRHASPAQGRPAGVRTLTVYDPVTTDPLIVRGTQARAWAKGRPRGQAHGLGHLPGHGPACHFSATSSPLRRTG